MATTRSRWIRIAVIAAAAYVLPVVVFESMLGCFQPFGGEARPHPAAPFSAA